MCIRDSIKTVNKVVLPELNDEFAAKAGPFTSIDDLRADITSEITAQKEREAGDALKDDLVKQLIAKSKVAVPAVLKDDQIRSIEQDLTQNLMYRGMTIEQYFTQQGYADREAWVKGVADVLSYNLIKAGLGLAELSKKLKIEATADERAAHVNTYKQPVSYTHLQHSIYHQSICIYDLPMHEQREPLDSLV